VGDGAEGFADVGGVGNVAVGGEEDGAEASGVGGVADVGIGGGGGAGEGEGVLVVVCGERGGEGRGLEERWSGWVGKRTCRRRGTLRECPRRRRSFGARPGVFRGGGGHLFRGAGAGPRWSHWDGTCSLDWRFEPVARLDCSAIDSVRYKLDSSRARERE